MNPPVRYGSEGHGDYLLEGLNDGRVNMIATDHSPHTAEEKLTTTSGRRSRASPASRRASASS